MCEIIELEAQSRSRIGSRMIETMGPEVLLVFGGVGTSRLLVKFGDKVI